MARTAGIVYLLFAALSVFSYVYVPQVVIVSGDAMATAGNLVSFETLYRLGTFGALLSMLLFVVLALTLQQLFGERHRSLAGLMVALVLVGVTLELVGVLVQVGALSLATEPDYGVALGGHVPNALYTALQLRMDASAAVHIFWGLWLFPLAAMILAERVMPAPIGYLLIAAGISYTLSGCLAVVAPHLRTDLASILTLLAAGELPVIVWLLVRGVRVPDPLTRATAY